MNNEDRHRRPVTFRISWYQAACEHVELCERRWMCTDGTLLSVQRDSTHLLLSLTIKQLTRARSPGRFHPFIREMCLKLLALMACTLSAWGARGPTVAPISPCDTTSTTTVNPRGSDALDAAMKTYHQAFCDPGNIFLVNLVRFTRRTVASVEQFVAYFLLHQGTPFFRQPLLTGK